jgi:hypothetical protein
MRNKGLNTATIPSSFSPADIFHHGIKKDTTLFPVLKVEIFNDTWHQSFVNQARSKDLSEVELFTEKQTFVYAILESKVLTDKGIAIVIEYEDTFDAQALYKKLT